MALGYGPRKSQTFSFLTFFSIFFLTFCRKLPSRVSDFGFNGLNELWEARMHKRSRPIFVHKMFWPLKKLIFFLSLFAVFLLVLKTTEPDLTFWVQVKDKKLSKAPPCKRSRPNFLKQKVMTSRKFNVLISCPLFETFWLRENNPIWYQGFNRGNRLWEA